MKRVLIGPPGTGKTTTATKIAYDRFKKFGNKIGYFAFTKRAASEALARMKFWLEGEDEGLDYFRTLHSLCFRELGLRKREVFNIDGFAEYAGLHCTKKKYDPDENEFYKGATEDDLIIFRIGLVKAKGINKEKALQSFDWECDRKRVKFVWDQMDWYKKIHGMKDFDDMLSGFAKVGRFPKLHTIILDEAQDLTFAQRQAFNALCAHNPDALIVEALDPDQAIFSWAGSEVNMDELCNGADVEVLGQSHRVPGPIHDFAMKVIKQCRIRRDVNWAPAKHEGSVQYVLNLTEIDKAHKKNLLVLVRNYCYAIQYMKWFKFDSQEWGRIGSNSPIRIATIHESKGAEADNVLLDLNMTKKTWDQAWTDDERRVWYTAITRAKKNLFVMAPQARCNANNIMP